MSERMHVFLQQTMHGNASALETNPCNFAELCLLQYKRFCKRSFLRAARAKGTSKEGVCYLVESYSSDPSLSSLSAFSFTELV